jgi:hypothetical protein
VFLHPRPYQTDCDDNGKRSGGEPRSYGAPEGPAQAGEGAFNQGGKEIVSDLPGAPVEVGMARREAAQQAGAAKMFELDINRGGPEAGFAGDLGNGTGSGRLKICEQGAKDTGTLFL